MISRIKDFIFCIFASVMTIWIVVPSLLLFLYAIIQAVVAFGLGKGFIENLPAIFQLTAKAGVSGSGVILFILWTITFFAGTSALNLIIKYCKRLWQKESNLEEMVALFIINQIPISLLVILWGCDYLLRTDNGTQAGYDLLGGILGGVLVMSFLEFLIIIPGTLFIWWVFRSLVSLILSFVELFEVDTSGIKRVLGGYIFTGGITLAYGGALIGTILSLSSGPSGKLSTPNDGKI